MALRMNVAKGLSVRLVYWHAFRRQAKVDVDED
ncbi:hypothetical protein ACVWYQ_004355 [Bradyrhizobium sp. USDA 3397]|jgi:hypothetical protein